MARTESSPLRKRGGYPHDDPYEYASGYPGLDAYNRLNITSVNSTCSSRINQAGNDTIITATMF